MKSAKRVETLFEVFRVVVAVLVAYLISLVLVSLVSSDPLFAIRQFIIGPFERVSRIGDMISLATPLMFTGLGMCFIYAVNKFNLIGEGAFIFSACIVGWVALQIGDSLPAVPMVIVLLLVGFICGAACGLVPALLDAKFKANVVVVSLMMNSILVFFTQYMIKYVIKDSTISITASLPLPKAALLPNIVPGTTIHLGLIFAIITTIICAALYYKTPTGFSMRTVGANSNFARYAGMGVSGTVVLAQALGGAIAGMGGSIEMLGRYTRFQWTGSTGHGFDGLVVAVLAYKNPALVPVGALLLAYIRTGADIVNRTTDIPAEFVSIIQGVIILLIAAEKFLSGVKRKIIFKSAKENLKKEAAQA